MTLFTVQWTRRAQKHLESLDTTVKLRILLRVEQARNDPLRFFDPLRGAPGFKLRVGDWRVIADIRLSDAVIEVVAVGHRRNVYGR